jgi:DNA polymerase III subunit delta
MPSPPAQAAAPLYLVCGEDDYSVKRRARQLFDQWSAELGGMDHEIIDGRVPNAGEALRALARLREALQTLPFFGTAKVVWLQDCSFLGDDRASLAGDVVETLAELGEELKVFRWEGVRLLISAGKVDRRKSFYKTIEKLGTVEMFAALSLEDKDWAARLEEAARKMIAARRKEVSEEALGRLVNHVGPNLQLLSNEIEKLSLYVGDRSEIEAADVDAIVTRNKLARAFALADAMGERNLPRLLRCLEDEIWSMQFDKGRSEIGLLYGLISKARSMILLKELQREKWIKAESGSYGAFKAQLDQIPPERLPEDKRYSPKGIHPYVLFNSLPHARKYTLEELVRAMELLLECNRKLISSQLDEKLVLQQTLVQIVRGESAPRASAAWGGAANVKGSSGAI